MPDGEKLSVTHCRRLWEEGLASGAAEERRPLAEFLN